MTIPFNAGDQEQSAGLDGGRASTCANCGNAAPKAVLARGDSREQIIVTSDGLPLDPCTVERLLCPSCGVLEAVCEPGDVLRQKWIRHGHVPWEDWMVVDGKAQNKRILMEPRLFDHVSATNKPTGNMLEIGCGEGHLTRRFAHRFQDWIAIGVDPWVGLTEDWPPIGGRPGFIRAFFDPVLFAGRDYDVVIAHGFLNQMPPLPELKRIRSICAHDAILSLEVLLLETAEATPHLWDHPFIATRARLLAFLQEAGFEVLESHNCISTWHIIARAVDPGGQEPAGAGAIAEAQQLFGDHAAWWRRLAARAEDAAAVAKTEGRAVALYGAGLFSAVLGSLAPAVRPTFFIDDEAAGGHFLDRPVLSLEEARGRPVTILVAMPPAHVPHILARLDKSGVPAIDLTST